MQITVRADSVELEGYVNAIERKSKPLWSRIGQFVERICRGAFKRALERNDDVRIMLNHTKDIGGQKDGNLELYEDNIGLHARATITDSEVVQKAKDGKLSGWSFGFYDREVEQKRDEDGFPLRNVVDLDLEEVSILDDTTVPAYDGTLVSVRSDEKTVYYGEAFTDEINLRMEVQEAEPIEERSEEVPKQQETVEPDKRIDEFRELINDMKN
jgi:HK97 family phage prohead protease